MTNDTAVAPGPLVQPIKGLAPSERSYPYRATKTATWVVIGLAAANILCLILYFAALVGQWQVLGQMAAGAFASREAMSVAAHASDARVNAFALLFLITVIAAYIAGGVWIYNAACNVRALGARGLDTSPGWAVGWYFVPFMCLFKPFLAMEEIDRASASPTAWGSQRTPGLLRWWWALWLLAGLSGNLLNVFRRVMTSSLAELSTLTVFQLIDAGVDIVATGLFIAVVWRIYRRQTATRAALSDVAEVFA